MGAVMYCQRFARMGNKSRLPVVGGSLCQITFVVMCDLILPNRNLLETIGGFPSI